MYIGIIRKVIKMQALQRELQQLVDKGISIFSFIQICMSLFAHGFSKYMSEIEISII